MKRFRSVGVHTQVCAVIGNPVVHSLSPAIHNAAYEALDLDFVYVAAEVSDLKGALDGLRAMSNLRGFSVTIPHKVEVMRYLDQVDVVDRSIGAINTVVCDQGQLIGSGADGPGALTAIQEAGVELNGKDLLLLGAGGAARSIAFPLVRTGKLAHITLLDINHRFLQQLGTDLSRDTNVPIHAEIFTAQSLEMAMQRADIIIHCTSVGMDPKRDASLIPMGLFRPDQVIFDVVYTPLATKLLRDAKSCGLQVISGVEMFIHQAVLQFEKFTGHTAPVEVMRRVVMEHLER